MFFLLPPPSMPLGHPTPAPLSLYTPGTLLPQDICTCLSLCLMSLLSGAYLVHSLTSFGSPHLKAILLPGPPLSFPKSFLSRALNGATIPLYVGL